MSIPSTVLLYSLMTMRAHGAMPEEVAIHFDVAGLPEDFVCRKPRPC